VHLGELERTLVHFGRRLGNHVPACLPENISTIPTSPLTSTSRALSPRPKSLLMVVWTR
jgi:hypothetical protein